MPTGEPTKEAENLGAGVGPENPYVGPRPFREDEQHHFFGRDEEIATLEGLALARQAMLLFAQSGAGKSSLLRAGLIPSLTLERMAGYGPRQVKYSNMSVLPVLSVGGEVPEGVDPEEVANVYVFSALLTLHPDEDRQQLLDLSLEEGLADSLARSQSSEDETDVRVPASTLLIFDQFEELFTRHTERWDERRGFFKQVQDALKRYSGLHVLFSMREDYIAELTPYVSMLPEQLRSQFRLERLREPAALDAIRKPAERAGRRFEEAAADLLVKRLRGGPASDAAPGEGAAVRPAEFVEPVQLQIVCRRLWENLDAEQISILPEDVERYGEVGPALKEFYEGSVGKVVQQTRISELRLRTWFGRPPLITPSGTRGLVYQGETDTGGLPNEVVEMLDKEYVIRPVRRGKDTWYELAHDRLVEPILQSNLEWRSKHAAEWQLRAEAWIDENKPPGLLLEQADLEKAEQWIEAQGYQPEPYEQSFLEYSRIELQRQAKALARQTEQRTNLADTGWGILFALDDPRAAEIERALGELLQRRSEQAGARYQIFSGPRENQPARGVKPDETAQAFQTRMGVGPGAVNYDRLPYYLLIIGGPDRIPFEFQYALQGEYAVGRLDFPDTADYARYARSVVMSENGSFSLLPKAGLFGPQDDADSATTRARNELLLPLRDTLPHVQQEPAWEVEDALGAEATRARLIELIGGPRAPALLFSTSFGASTPIDDEEQEDIQGAVMLQVNPTPKPLVKPESPEAYLAASDIDDDLRLLGSIAFLFGAWSAGTPRFNNFPPTGKPAQEIASRAFVARLPQRLLGHPKGGMLAVIGHVDMIFTSAFTWQGVELAMNHFDKTLRRLMKGYTVGAAMEPFSQRHALLSSMLAEELRQVFFYQAEQDDRALARLNRYTVDARNFIILGDPAVRLPLENGPIVLKRPTIEPVEVETKAVRAEVGPESVVFEGVRLPPEEEGEPEAVPKPVVVELGPASEEVEPGFLPEFAESFELPTRGSGQGSSWLYFNGIDGATGAYAVPPMTVEDLAKIIMTTRSPENLRELRFKARQGSL